MTFLLPFATTYLCKQEFSARNRADSGDDLRLALSKIKLCIEDITI